MPKVVARLKQIHSSKSWYEWVFFLFLFAKEPFTSNDELEAYLIESEQYLLNPGPGNRYIMGTIFARVVELIDTIEGLREDGRPGEWWKNWTF